MVTHIERLTDSERLWLARYTPGAKACRIIDQLTEALAAAERDYDTTESDMLKWTKSCLTAEARVRELTEIERTLRSSEANKRILAAIEAIESARLAVGGVETAWSKQALRALRGEE